MGPGTLCMQRMYLDRKECCHALAMYSQRKTDQQKHSVATRSIVCNQLPICNVVRDHVVLQYPKTQEKSTDTQLFKTSHALVHKIFCPIRSFLAESPLYI